MSQPISTDTCESQLSGIHSQLEQIEKSVFSYVLSELETKNPGRDRTKCDAIFSYYTQAYLIPCVSSRLASRAAHVGGYTLISQVLELEKKMDTQFHKGVLFHDTGLAQLMSGNEDGYEYFLAMTDEEEVRTTPDGHQRGTINLRGDGLAARTIDARMQFASDFLNGQIANHAANYAFLTGLVAMTPVQFDAWRKTLAPLHQFELLRLLHDINVFGVDYYSDYEPVKDNPFIMLRLAKALSHLAQWVESCLTEWQGPGGPKTLARKLSEDPDFGNALVRAANGNEFPGRNVQGAAVGVELRELLSQLSGAITGNQRHWRLLRILLVQALSGGFSLDGIEV